MKANLINLRTIDEGSWRAQSASFLDDNYRQLWAFGQACADRVGAVSEHIMLSEAGQTLGLADVRIREIPLLGGGIAYINGGPLVRQGDPEKDEAAFRRVIDTLIQEYVNHRGLILRIQPMAGEDQINAMQRQVLEDAGLVSAPHTTQSRTILLDLDPNLDDIRANFAQKWRNCLNASERSGVSITSSRGIDDFRRFQDLFEPMRQHKGFEVDLDASFYADVQERMRDDERFDVTLAWHEGTTVAGHVSSTRIETCVYLLGATSDAGRRTKAAYLLQWHAIKNARKQGCRFYDLGGIDPVGNPGVYRFKRGMGGVEIEGAGTFQVGPSTFAGQLTIGLERTRRRLKLWRDNRRKSA